MSTPSAAPITWARALAWRMERQLLDPMGSESLAEPAVRTRRTTSRPGELAAALAAGEVIKAFAFRGSMHYLSPVKGGIYLTLRSEVAGNPRP